MREGYADFTARAAEIVAIGPDGPRAFETYWENERIPFIGLSDPEHYISDTYDQEVSLFKMGRMPALFVIDKHGRVRYKQYGKSMSDIPQNKDILEMLDEINKP